MVLHELLSKISDSTPIAIYHASTLSDYKSRREVPARMWNMKVKEITVYQFKLNVEVTDT